MSINRIELQGTITRAQDYTTIKHNQDNKGMVDQSNFQAQFHKTVEIKQHRFITATIRRITRRSMMQKKKETGNIPVTEGKSARRTRIRTKMRTEEWY